MIKFLSKEDIQNCVDIVKEEVQVPEWGGSVFVRTMMADERDEWEYETFVKGNESNLKSKGKLAESASNAMKKIRASLVVLTAVDSEGNRLFTRDDIDWLGKKNAKAVDRVYEVAQRINGMRKEDLDIEIKN